MTERKEPMQDQKLERETEGNRQRAGEANFNEILFEPVHEAFDVAAGQIVSEPFALHLQKYLGISNDEPNFRPIL